MGDTLGMLFALALAPTVAGLVYMYIRDKYEKEPLRLLAIGIIFGIVVTFPIIQAETFITAFLPVTGQLGEAFYISFVVAALVEEAFKFIILFFLIWFDKNLNEPLDGIVYSVFISLGFAGLENFLYVFNPELGGISTAVMRAVVSVPSHALFAVFMGYFFAVGKFVPEKRVRAIIYAFIVPWLLHGVYDFILLSGMPYYLVLFIPFVLLMWRGGLKRIKKHLSNSPFNPRFIKI